MFLLAQDASGLGGLAQFAPLILVGIVFWFLILRPQRKAKAEREEMLQAVKAGDEVVTIGGIFGEVEALDDKWVDLHVGDDVVLRMTRGSIGRIASDDELAAIETFASGGTDEPRVATTERDAEPAGGDLDTSTNDGDRTGA